MTPAESDPRVIVALDFPAAEPALALARRLPPAACRLKVGKELFVAEGPQLLARLAELGHQVFLDLKFHDIPNTVAGACAAAARHGVWMINVHALGGRRMMEAARERLEGLQHRPLLVAVTVLTSMDEAGLREIGLDGGPDEAVRRLALLARDSGLDGVVCSAREAPLLRRAAGEAFLLVTPGIRPAGSAHDDQQRVVTPPQALQLGADYLVIGRPVTRAQDPAGALERINQSLV